MMDSKNQELDLSRCAEQISFVCQRFARNRKVGLVLGPSGGVPTVQGHSFELLHLMFRLVVLAMDVSVPDSKITLQVGMQNEEICITVTGDTVAKYLGIPKFRRKIVDREPEVGLVVGLAWTMAGGEILEIEAASVPGSGKITITGNLKDVMKESAETALSYARGLCREMSGEWFKKKQIHIHVPEGAIPKDGPSAGIALATAIVSLLREVPVRSDVAMTGEITLRGRVLPIGGLPEKAVAAIRAGSQHLIIPKENEKDFLELAPVIRKQLKVHLVETMDEVLDLGLVGGSRKSARRRRAVTARSQAAPAVGRK